MICFLLLSLIGSVITGSPATDQLPIWAKVRREPMRATNLFGKAAPSLTASQSISSRGEILLQDFTLVEKLATFNRERIPERVVHAKGAGAHGYFVVTHDVSQYTKARFLSFIGKRTPVMVRFSTVGGERGTADTAVDPHGFAIKFYTEVGNYDLVGNSVEPFPIRDPILFSDLNRSRKRNPQTNLGDQNMWWDFTSLRPESSLHTLHLFSDNGRPDGFRRADGFGVHTYKLVNRTGGVVFNKFRWMNQQRAPALTFQRAKELVGSNPEYKTQDLYDAIANGNFPCWNFSIQVMTVEQSKTHPRNPFDITRTWRVEDFPLIPVGRMCLDKNPSNYFAEIEQAAFAPSNMVPGIEPSPDRMLAGRLFAYQDAQRYRLGTNAAYIPVNKPLSPVNTYIRDGKGNVGDNGGGSPNYFPNSYCKVAPDVDARESTFDVEGVVDRIDVREDEHIEAKMFLDRDVDAAQRVRMVEAIADRLKDANQAVRDRTLQNIFDPISRQLGDEIRAAMAKAQKK